MSEQEKVILAIASRLLSYPEEDCRSLQTDIKECIRDNVASAALTRSMADALAPLFALSPWEARQLYVETFDLKEKAGLYLTAQELGDGRKRGVALIDLQQLIEEAGFERCDGELADYMPMLFELLAAAPDEARLEPLRRRLAAAVQRIFRQLDENNPYRTIFGLMLETVFEQPSAEELARMDQEWVKPDLDPMPYPLLYSQA